MILYLVDIFLDPLILVRRSSPYDAGGEEEGRAA
jgi:hypothetical protein